MNEQEAWRAQLNREQRLRRRARSLGLRIEIVLPCRGYVRVRDGDDRTIYAHDLDRVEQFIAGRRLERDHGITVQKMGPVEVQKMGPVLVQKARLKDVTTVGPARLKDVIPRPPNA